ncbi:MAG: hypothetical protein ONB05_09065 [candidate division KSB1 bacterium]|nr:hypothetical protein [candidate division KSB1 bacterium]
MVTHTKYSNPYRGKGNWYKVNLHAHCAEHSGCAAIPLKTLIAEYVRHGYDFLAITDHDSFTVVPPELHPREMVLLSGFEYSSNPHMLCLGVRGVILSEHQKTIDTVKAQGGIVILSHPNWEMPPHWSREQMLQLTGFCGLEIFNGVIDRLVGDSLAVKEWDYLLSRGKRCWGFGADDSHELFDIGRVWIKVRAEKGEISYLFQALKEGNFYVSTGLDFRELSLIENKIHIETDEETAFRFVGPEGKILKYHLGHLAEYWIEGWEDYVRVEGWNRKGWFWTQPFWGE